MKDPLKESIMYYLSVLLLEIKLREVKYLSRYMVTVKSALCIREQFLQCQKCPVSAVSSLAATSPVGILEHLKYGWFN